MPRAGEASPSPSLLFPGEPAGGPLSRTLGKRELVIAIVLGLGVGLRVLNFLHRRSLWIDEARLALNIGVRSFGDLIRPLDYDQSAPLGFLWGVKLSTVLFGVNEIALRLFPMLAGLAALCLFYPLARRFLGRFSATMAVLYLALAPTLIYYANEVKPYSLDLLAAVLLLRCAVVFLDHPGSVPLWPLALGGAAAIWFSAGSPFVLAAIIGALLLIPGLPSRIRLGRVLLLLCAWVPSFLLAYTLVYREAAQNPYMRRFWSAAFLRPSDPAFSLNLWAALRGVLWGTFMGHLPSLRLEGPASALISAGSISAALAVSLGLRRTARLRGAAVTVLLIAPVAFAFAASVAGAFPLALRLVLFSAPGLYILAMSGLENRLGLILAGLVLSLPLLLSVGDATSRHPAEHLRPLVQRFERAGRGEPVYVYSGSIPAWLFYTTDWAEPDSSRLAAVAKLASSGGPGFENAGSRGSVVHAAPASMDMEYHGRTELMGLHSGLENSGNVGPRRLSLDSGWVAQEASRIVRASHPDVWVIMSHLFGPEGRLLGCVAQLGGEIRTMEVGYNALLIQFRFSAAPRLDPAELASAACA